MGHLLPGSEPALVFPTLERSSQATRHF